MVLGSYVLTRTTGRFLLLLAIFVGIVGGGQVALTMARGVPIDALVNGLWPMVMFSLPIAFPLAMATAVLTSLGAMQRDGELRALAACGISEVTVASRLWPLVVGGVLVSALLSHVLLPQAMAQMRANRGMFDQAAIAYRVAAQKPIFDSERGAAVWARSAAGRTLEDVYATHADKGIVTSLHAANAGWFLGKDGEDEGLGIQLNDVRGVRQFADGRVQWLEAPSAQYPRIDQTPDAGRQTNPDSLSTPRVLAILDDPTQRRRAFNNARLTLHVRLYTPVALAIFCVFAAGLALVLRSSDNLVGIILMVVLVSGSTLPAIFYVKNAVDHVLFHPAWLLWPPALTMLVLGLGMLLRPDRAREIAGRPLDAIGDAVAWLGRGVAALGRGTVVVLRRGSRSRLAAPAERVAAAGEPIAAAVVPRGLSTLDRFILRRAVSRWFAVMFIGVFLIALGDFVSRSNMIVRSLFSEPQVYLQYLLFRLPEFAALWLPLSALTAGMLVAWPLLRQGNIMMLSASGIAPRRVFAALIPFALAVSALSLAISDQLVPRTAPIANDLEDHMNVKVDASGQLQRRVRRSERSSAAGWRTADAFWAVRGAVPGRGLYEQVAVFGHAPGAPLAVLAERLAWTAEGWRLEDITVLTAAAQRRLASATPAELGIPLPRDRRALALDLRPEHGKTSTELIRAPTARTWRVIVVRALNALTPLLCLLLALPSFTRWHNRFRIGSATAVTLILALVPLGLLAIASRMITASAQDPLLVGGLLATALLAIAATRWLRMKV